MFPLPPPWPRCHGFPPFFLRINEPLGIHPVFKCRRCITSLMWASALCRRALSLSDSMRNCRLPYYKWCGQKEQSVNKIIRNFSNQINHQIKKVFVAATDRKIWSLSYICWDQLPNIIWTVTFNWETSSIPLWVGKISKLRFEWPAVLWK